MYNFMTSAFFLMCASGCLLIVVLFAVASLKAISYFFMEPKETKKKNE